VCAPAARLGWTPPLTSADLPDPDAAVFSEADEAKLRLLPPARATAAPPPPPPTPPAPVDAALVAALAAVAHANALHRDVDLRERALAIELSPPRAGKRLHPRARLVLWIVAGAFGAYALVLLVFATQIATGQIPAEPPPLVQTTTIPATPAD
jgi:hypothetical protein